MPSEMAPQGSSASFFPDERQASAWKMNDVDGYYGLKTDYTVKTTGIASPALENRIPADFQMEKGFDLPNYYLSRGRNVNHSSGKHHLVGAEGAASRSLPSAVDHHLAARHNLNMETASYCLDGDKINLIGAQHENSLFSSSLSDLFARKLKLPGNNEVYGHSVGATPSPYEEEEALKSLKEIEAVGATPSPYEEEEALKSLKEIEAQTIGNLLPDDDDLLSGVIDGFHGSVRTNNADDVEDLDLFSSVGGLELGEDGFSQINFERSAVNFNNELGIYGVSNVGHPSREIPSRTLIVRNISSDIEDAEIRTLFQQYGEVHTLYTSSKHRGFVMVSYYDIRAACNAMKALLNKQLLHRKLDIYFSLPKDNSLDKDINQGSLVVFNLDSSVSNDQLRGIFGAYGEIKEIREAPHRSLCFVEFYDIRASESALRALNWSEVAGRKIKLELAPPGDSKSLMQTLLTELEQEESGLRQQCGSPSSMTNGFSGSLSLGSNFIRDNGTVLGPFSTNGGSIGSLLDNVLHTGVSSSVPNSLSALSRVESATIAESSHLRNELNFDIQGMANFHPRSFPEIHDSLANGIFGSPRTMAANITARAPEIINGQQFRRASSNGQSIDFNEGKGSCPPPGCHYLWNNNNPNHPLSQSTMWPNSPSFVNGMTAAHSQQQLHPVPRAASHMLNTLHPLNNHHVGSAPSMNHLWDRRQTYTGDSPDATMFLPGSLGNMGISGTSPHPLEFVHHSIYPQTAGNGMDIAIPSRSIGLHPHHQSFMAFPARGQMMPMMGSFDSPNERTRSRRHDGGTGQSDNKKQFELDLDRILQGEDKRTTLMIKNIPNKYTSKMLLAAIDERHKGTYDFIYLPIDFKNKCNVGYAFINMTEPSQIVPFYQSINGRKWEKFNSEKVATLAYARIQGKAALIAHFQNSSLMNEDKRCRPILFHTDGPNAGDQVPFPMGSNIRPRSGKVRANTSEENSQRLPSNSINEDYYNGDLSSGSGKDSD